MYRFESPWCLLLVLLVVLQVFWRLYRRRRRAALAFSSVANVRKAGKSLRQRLAWLPDGLRYASLVLLIVGLARPQAGRERIQEISQGIAIEMVLDRSGSMGLEMEFEGQMKNRLDCAKAVFSRFVFGNGKDLKGRRNDLVGMVAFARYADTVCPMTLTHSVVKPFLGTVKLAETEQEDGTAIGDALALGAARLHTVEESLAAQNRKDKGSYKIKNKVLILLTDGENNCGRRNVLQGGEVARKWGIRVYVIALGGDDVYQNIHTPFGDMRRRVMTRPIDTTDLAKVAEESGGFLRKATDARALQAVYAEIDSLERSDVESTRFVDYSELYVPLVLAAFALLALEQVLACTVFRRLP